MIYDYANIILYHMPSIYNAFIHDQISRFFAIRKWLPHTFDPVRENIFIYPGFFLILYKCYNEIPIHSIEILSSGFFLRIKKRRSFSPLKLMPSKTVRLLLDPDFFIETIQAPLFTNVTPDTMSKSILVLSILVIYN